MNFAENRYETMKYNRCGKSGLKLPAIAFGCWHNFGEMTDPQESRRMLHRALDLGITHFDLANNYGPPPGAAETLTGKILSEDFAAHRDELIISTKAGYLMGPGPYGEWGSRKNLLASLDQSLKRLRLEYVDIFYSHRPDPETPLEETIGALHTAVTRGKALYAGISNYGAAESIHAARLASGLRLPLVINQLSYSLLNRGIEQDVLPALKEIGMGVIAFCPLGKGLLTSRYFNGIPADSRAAAGGPFLKPAAVKPQIMAVVKRLNEIAGRRGQTMAQMALAWVLRNDRVISALIGASRTSQIEENVAALKNTSFTVEEIGEIDGVLQSSDQT